MNIPETALLLAMLAANDRRTVGDVDVEVWHDALSDLPFDDCRDAVRQLIRSSGQWITPFLVRQGVKAIRSDRLARAVDQVPDADPDDPSEYARALRENRMRTADGLQPRDLRAITSVFPSPPPADWQPAGAAPRNAPSLTGLPVVDPERMAQARAEIAARHDADEQETADA
jgi:hypothetical protein